MCAVVVCSLVCDGAVRVYLVVCCLCDCRLWLVASCVRLFVVCLFVRVGVCLLVAGSRVSLVCRWCCLLLVVGVCFLCVVVCGCCLLCVAYRPLVVVCFCFFVCLLRRLLVVSSLCVVPCLLFVVCCVLCGNCCLLVVAR